MAKNKTTRMPTWDEAILAARETIGHPCDGPLTAFVLISRAMEGVKEGQMDSELAANALDAELTERGFLARRGCRWVRS